VRSFIFATLLVATSLAVIPQTPSIAIDVKSKMDEGMAAFRAHDYKRALAAFNQVTEVDPNNILAHNLAGNCSLEMRDFAAAIRSFQRALQLQPDQAHNLAGLVRSYAQAGMSQERDVTLERLHALSRAGRLPANFSYVFDSFSAGDRSVLVTEFPQLAGRFHFRYQFSVHDATGKEVSFVALESDDADQSNWPNRHPEEAATAKRTFSLDSYSKTASGQTHSLYKFYDGGEPSYRDVRADVEKLLAGTLKPMTLTTTGAPQPSASPIPQP